MEGASGSDASIKGFRFFDGTGSMETVASSSGEKTGVEVPSSLDALKNTPSNIARLEDIIEQSKARHKYLARTKSPSDGDDVRWYFCKVPLAPNQIAASVPKTEIVGEGEYFRFSMRDSLALEASFLQNEEECLFAWWKEYAECSEGPDGSGSVTITSRGIEPKSSNVSGQKLQCSSDSALSSGELYGNAEEAVGVPVKGGLYEVDISKRYCFPVYWHGENRRVLRGHWFARKGGSRSEWLPLREDIAEQLEFAYRSQVWHRRTFQPSGQFAARVDLQGATQSLHALFTGEDDTWEAWLGVDSSSLLLVIGVRGNGIKLRRGFAPSGSPQPTQDELRQQREEEMDDYCSQVPVRHLVFMVHGIGQRLEKANLVDDVATFRHIVASLAEQHLTSFQRNTQRVLFIPCQWRRSLKLQGEATVEKITLEGVRGLRTTLSATVHDVLYYMSPIYCQDIIDSVSNQLNSLYLKFLKRNPGYDGKVSIYGHSLGSVLSYDILCHQDNLSSVFPIENINQTAVPNKEQVDRGDSFSSEISAGSPAISKLKEKNGNAGGNSSKEAGIESKKESEAIYVPEDNAIDSLCKEGTTEYSKEATVELKEERQIHISSQQTTDEAAQHNMAVGAQEQAMLEPKEQMEVLNNEDVAGTEVSMPEIFVNNMCKNPAEVIKSLKEEVLSLQAKIMELDGKHKVNETSVITVIDDRPLLYSLENSEVVDDSTVGEDKLNCRTLKKDRENNSIKGVESGRNYTPTIKYTKLVFKVDTFFAVGSPLGVFLSLRNVRIGTGNGQDYWQDEGITEEIPNCRQMFNIFHPYDPVAYRVEPLVCKNYVDKQPVFIPYHKGGKRLHIGIQEFREDISNRSKAFLKRLNSVKTRVVHAVGARRIQKDEDKENSPNETSIKTYGSKMMERLTGSPDGRIDYMLQNSTFEHPYIAVIGSHTSYWRDFDTALFILNHLYREIPPEPPEGSCTDGADGMICKDQGALQPKNGGGCKNADR
ncbi:phospholipase SGR2 isoform X3 [Cryptomeria japonica]|uniref:phospholipase SGR2 isoform X3 n=1 Tax=Cryptomeria japonica TaxID=3369 RepID=UPI0027D9D665|nr:phospholipase SGR2 isoform X3 [Cryptomeria japonica]